MARFKNVIIIYNPKSTGDSPAMAKSFSQDIKEWNKSLNVRLKETKHAGHGREIAFQAAKKYGRDSLIVSVSGDGGYHEVINGVMEAAKGQTSLPFCAVLPGGNANDHYSSVYDRPLIEAIKAGTVRSLDLLTVSVGKKEYYAHSYAGLGISPLVAIELNKHDLSAIKEIWLAVKTFWKFRPFTIDLDSQELSFDSLIFGNIRTMAKHLTLDEDSRVNDGKFEVLRWPHSRKFLLLARLALSALGRGKVENRVSKFEFKTVTPMPMQLDGEILKLESHAKIVIEAKRHLLKTFI